MGCSVVESGFWGTVYSGGAERRKGRDQYWSEGVGYHLEINNRTVVGG